MLKIIIMITIFLLYLEYFINELQQRILSHLEMFKGSTVENK